MRKNQKVLGNRPANRHIRSGDLVIALSGNEKGKTGRVLRREGDRLVVEGFLLRKKAIKPKGMNRQGGFVTLPMPIHASNVALCTPEGTAVSVRVRLNENNKRELVYQQGDEQIVHRVL